MIVGMLWVGQLLVVFGWSDRGNALVWRSLVLMAWQLWVIFNRSRVAGFGLCGGRWAEVLMGVDFGGGGDRSIQVRRYNFGKDKLLKAVMSEKLSFEEIQDRYDGEWVLVVHGDLDENLEILSGEVWAHSSDVDGVD
jgi:hypothetical protein